MSLSCINVYLFVNLLGAGDKCSGPCTIRDRCSTNCKELAKEVKKMHDHFHDLALDHCTYHCPLYSQAMEEEAITTPKQA